MYNQLARVEYYCFTPTHTTKFANVPLDDLYLDWDENGDPCCEVVLTEIEGKLVHPGCRSFMVKELDL